LNAQYKFDKDGNVLKRGIEWCSIFGPGTGYTANPVRGCTHGCRWQMPDGKWVDCYAETQRDRLDGKGAFKHITYHADVLDKIERHRDPAGIFIDSMSDLCGEGVQTSWIVTVIKLMERCSHHVFFVLTKNPRRLTEFEWPENALVGISAPPTEMYGKKLSEDQQRTWFTKGMEWLRDCSAKNKWVSLEPLSTGAILCSLSFYGACLKWAVIGAGSDGQKTYQPDESLFYATLLECRVHDIKVFYKGNLARALAKRHGGWREEFPDMGQFPEASK
jgi:protein gp37